MHSSKKLARPKAGMIAAVFFAVALLLMMGACAPQQQESEGVDAAAEQPDASAEETKEDPIQIDLAFSMASDCTVCHKNAMESEENVLTVASVHKKEASIACTTCHNQESELTEAHANAESMDEPRRLKETEVTEETCLSCHESYEALAAKTADVTVLTDANGLTVNPHEAKQLNAEHAEEITCLKCHSEHDEKDDTKSQSYCMNCHHMKVYECNTCHTTD